MKFRKKMNFEAYIDKFNTNVLIVKTIKMVNFYIFYTCLRIKI